MKTICRLKDGYCVLSPQVALILVSFQDRRCHTAPNQTHVCVWEGDFEAIFQVIYITNRQSHLVNKIKLNDHDYKSHQSNVVKLPNGQKLSLKGGHVSGFKQTNNLNFEINYNFSA